MKSTMTLEVDTDTLLRLIGQLKARGGKQDVSAVINDAIELWMREQSKLNMNGDPASIRGYQWKSLFLPEGTQLRSWSYGEHNYALVVGDQIIHNGKSVSPNQFAQSFARAESSAAPAPARDTTPGQGWDLPERRKFRFRLGDVGFE